MTFSEWVLNMESVEDDISRTISKASSICDAFAKTYMLERNELYNRMVVESSNDEEFLAIESEKKDDLISRTATSVQKVVEKTNSGVQIIYNDTVDFFESDKVKSTLDSFSQKIKDNPALATKEIKIGKPSDIEKIDSKYVGTLKEMITRFRSGRFLPDDEKKFLDLRAEYGKERNQISSASDSVMTVKDILKVLQTKVPKPQPIKVALVGKCDESNVGLYSKVLMELISATERIACLHCTWRRDAFQKLKSSVSSKKVTIKKDAPKEKKDEKDDKPVKESTDLNALLDDIITEAQYELDSFNEFNETADEFLDKIVEEVTGDPMTADEYLDYIESQLFTDHDDEIMEESTDNSFDEISVLNDELVSILKDL